MTPGSRKKVSKNAATTKYAFHSAWALALTAFIFSDASAQQPPIHEWLSTLHRDHPLTGVILEVATGRTLDISQLAAALRQADLLLLGEKHDNPDHHRLRMDLLNGLFQEQRIQSLTMEMLTTAQQAAVDAVANDPEQWLDDSLPVVLNWDAGWTWDFYRAPLLAALSAGTPIRAGNLSREDISQIYAQALPAPAPLADDQMSALFDEIDRSHCGLLPNSGIPAMVRVQQARDQQMAHALTQSRSPGTGINVLLAGNFHVRHDLGVSNYLNLADLDTTQDQVISVAFLEVDPARTTAQAFLDPLPGRRSYDYVWFTPAIEVPDYCETMRASMMGR